MKIKIPKNVPFALIAYIAANIVIALYILVDERWVVFVMVAMMLVAMSAVVISVYGLFEKPKEPEYATRVQTDRVVVKEKAEILRVYTRYEVGTVLEPEKFRVIVEPEVNGCEGCYFLSDDRDCCNMLCDGIIYKQISDEDNV